jgi:glycosyltransferase involved in cell wall biosynthesis
MDKTGSYKVTIIAPTCFYYQVPLFRELASNPRIDLTVYFCSDEGITGADIKAAYRSDDAWGVQDELLDGYHSRLLKNHAPNGSYLKSLVGLANFGIWGQLSRERPDVVIVMSWMNPTWWLTILACVKLKIPLLFLTDANGDAERYKSGWKLWIKRNLLGKILFRVSSGFLCAGTANRRFYIEYGVPANKMYAFAYSWGYDILVKQSDLLRRRKMELRRQHGLPEDATILLYCGRLSPEKGSVDLLEAFKLVPNNEKALVLVGDGQLRNQMEESVDTEDLESIYFMGFQNRNDIGEFYALADILVLPSHSETWGIVVSEALCFSLPVIVSDQVGAGADLVFPGENGRVFPAHDVPALAECITELIELPEQLRTKMGTRSQSLISEWSDKDLPKMLCDHLDAIGRQPVEGSPGRFLAFYRILPEWFARNLAFILVGAALGFGLLLLGCRPTFRRIRSKLKLRWG